MSDAHPLSFLLSQYERRVYWFEVVECCRRLLLSGAVILFGPGTPVQLVVSLFVCAFSIKIYSFYEPQREYDDDLLTEVSQWQIFCILVCSLMLRYREMISDVDEDAVYEEENERMGWIILFVVLFGFVFMLSLIVSIIMREEREFKEDVEGAGRSVLDESSSPTGSADMDDSSRTLREARLATYGKVLGRQGSV